MEEASSGDAACAVTARNELWCWGANDLALLGLGTGLADQVVATPRRVDLTGVEEVAMDSFHACARSMTEVYCWGFNTYGELGTPTPILQPAPQRVPWRWPAGLSRVAVGQGFSCVTAERAPDGQRLWCWGAGTELFGGTGLMSSSPIPLPIPGLDATLAVAGGLRGCTGRTLVAGDPPGLPRRGVWCAGILLPRDTRRTLAEIPWLRGTTRLSLGPGHACNVDDAGQLRCWGDNDTGQLGTDLSAGREGPSLVRAMSHTARVIPSTREFLALHADGAVTQRVSGDNGVSTSVLRAPYFNGRVVRDIAIDRLQSSCFIDRAADLFCADRVRAAFQPLPTAPTMAPIERGVARVAIVGNAADSGLDQVCSLSLGGAVSCRDVKPRSRPDPMTFALLIDYPLAVPQPVPGAGWVGVAGGLSGRHGCVWNQTGKVSCWGDNGDGQAAPTPGAAPVLTATRVPCVAGALSVVTGRRHSCAVTSSGGVTCWGAHGLATPGAGVASDAGCDVATIDATSTDAAGPRPDAAVAGGCARVPDVTDAAEVVAGAQHSCVRRRGGTVLCWGENGHGQLGDGTYDRRDRPVEVLRIRDAEELFAGPDYTCARRRTGQVVCWGNNANGQIDDTFDDRNTPTPAQLIP